MWNDKKIMEFSGSEIFQQRRQRWLQYGRALLTIGILGLLTIALYTLTHSNSTSQQQDSSSRIIQSDEIAIEVFSEKSVVKRAVSDEVNDKIPKNNFQQMSSNELDMDSQHLKMFRRQQNNNNNIVHQHSDNGIYVFKGYKCVPIRKPTKQLEFLRARQRVRGMCVCRFTLLIKIIK